MSTTEWLTDIGTAADELNYGIREIGHGYIVLIAKQDPFMVRIETNRLTGDFLRQHLQPIPHRSGSGYTADFAQVQAVRR